MSASLLQVRDLHVMLPGGAHAVDGIDLDIRAGEQVGLVGESGSGKSLTAAALLDLLPRGARLQAARLSFAAHDLLTLGASARRRQRGRGIALVSQHAGNALNPVRTIGEQMGDALRRALGGSAADAARRGRDALQALELPDTDDLWQRYPHALSGGQKSRVLLALAFACQPRLLIADEPTSALDTGSRAQLIAAMRAATRQSGVALLLITHDLDLVAECTDSLAVMYAGRIVESGATATILRTPWHPYTEALLNCRVAGQRAGSRLIAVPGSPPPPQARPGGCAFHPRCGYQQPLCSQQAPRPMTAGRRSVSCHLATATATATATA